MIAARIFSTYGSPSRSPSPPPITTASTSSRLSADAMPGFNDGYRWTAGRTVPESPSGSFGTCQRFSTTSIGAERALVRRFQAATSDPSASHDAAGELVAQFPDPQTARRAFSVLTSWRAGCAERLRGHTRPTLGPLQPVVHEPQLERVDPLHGRARDVANRVPARPRRGEPNPGKTVEDRRDLRELDEVELDVLPGGQLDVAFAELVRQAPDGLQPVG